jgi:uncharacterized protein
MSSRHQTTTEKQSDSSNGNSTNTGFANNMAYILVSILLGIVFVKAEIVSWFRIQEMFRLQSFFMYGVIGTAVLVAMLSLWLLRRFKTTTIKGEKIQLEAKESNKGQLYGGLIFGIGWAITGACPGPLYAQIGAGFLVVCTTLLSALFGTWVYGYFRDKLPH